jgi:hypothetical protein
LSAALASPTPEGGHILAGIKLHRAIARAHEEYADSLAALTNQTVLDETPTLRGSLQRRIVGLPQMATGHGMTSRQVAAATTGDEPNCHSTLKRLAATDVVEIVEGASPQRFRLAVKHRRNRVLQLSRLIKPGEWTTYGEFSIAVYENVRMALTVARVAAHHPAFSSPHRILQSGGTVSEDWRDEDGNPGPEECKRRLRLEGVWSDPDDCADPDKFLPWEALRRRLENAEASNDADIDHS